MSKISVVIITKNEAKNINACIESARKLSNDIIVIDSGSTDATVSIAERQGVKIRSISWNGYGNARNTGAMIAANDWIFALDADERISDQLARFIDGIDHKKTNWLYGFKRINFFRGIQLKHGVLGQERVFRLYNRRFTEWNNEPVHEKLLIKDAVLKIQQQPLLHFGINDLQQYRHKKMRYAYLCAVKYMQHGKKAAWFYRLVSPCFYFLQSYIFKLGFLDGNAGFITTKINAIYTWKKYDHLCRMMKNDEVKEIALPKVNSTPAKKIYAEIVHAD